MTLCKTPFQTWPSGNRHDLSFPVAALISRSDIARSLTSQNRWTGYTPRPYSVAEHSVRVMLAGPRQVWRAALSHDFSEAFLHDVSAPLKSLLPDYRALEALWQGSCDAAFGVLPGDRGNAVVGFWDRRLQSIEKETFFGLPSRWHENPVYDWELEDFPDYQDRVEVLKRVGSREAEATFLEIIDEVFGG